MGVKVEFVLVIIIVAIAVMMLGINIDIPNISEKRKSKELEFYQTRFTEVTTEDEVGVAFSGHGVRENGYLYLEDLFYRNRDIEAMRAKSATYQNRILLLEGNVSLVERGGYRFFTQQAFFNKESGLLTISAPFLFTRGEDRFSGKSLQYDTKKRAVEAIEVNATLLSVAGERKRQEGM